MKVSEVNNYAGNQINTCYKRWGKFYAVDDLSLDMEDNSFITLLGPSGCGKTLLYV